MKATYRKRPVVVEAVQYTGTNLKEVARFVGCDFDEDSLTIRTKEGHMHVSTGDFVVKGVHGEFYPVKPDIFIATYEMT